MQRRWHDWFVTATGIRFHEKFRVFPMLRAAFFAIPGTPGEICPPTGLLSTQELKRP